MQTVTTADLAAEVSAANDRLTIALTSGNADLINIAIYRRKYEIMLDQWTNSKTAVIKTYGGPCISKTDRLNAWGEHTIKQAWEEVAYEHVPDTGHGLQLVEKLNELGQYSALIAGNLNNYIRYFKNIYTGVSVMYEANPQTPKYVKILLDGFRKWFNGHVLSDRFLRQKPAALMDDFLKERPDMVLVLNFIHALPKVKTEIQEDIDRPLAVEAIEFTLSLVPVVGNGIALYEAWSGIDMFGYRLSNLERGVLAASVLLPVVGRLVKSGRALYTEARLVKLYGGDAASWTKTIQSSARAAEQRAPMRAIRAAEDTIRAGRKLQGKIAQDAADGIPKFLHSPGNIPKAIESEIQSLWDTLLKKYPAVASLDVFALRRVVQKGANVDHIKGQLLEELAESFVLPMLRSRQGGFALGLKAPVGKTLEFIPGHTIRTASGNAGRQITDGMVGYWDKQVFNILGIFEAKSGRKGARELSFKTTDVGKLSKVDLAELRAFAKEVWAEQKEIAEKSGNSFTKTIEKIEEDILQDTSGQIRSDIERLDELGDGTLPEIRIDGVVHPVRLRSVTKTKFFGIVPMGVRTSLLQTEVRAEGFLFEAIAVPVHTKDLGKIAEEVKGLAERMIQKVP